MEESLGHGPLRRGLLRHYWMVTCLLLLLEAVSREGRRRPAGEC